MIHSLTLKDFRNYTDQSFVFEEKNIVFYGPNGQGKTNILEALSLLSVGKSWREQKNIDLVHHTQESALIEAVLENQDLYKIFIQASGKSFEKNGKKISLNKHFGSIASLLFAPEHLHLFAGSKKDRLRFFDRFLFQFSPVLRTHLSRFQKALKNKNLLLKSQNPWEDASSLMSQLAPWEKILAETIPEILQIRKDFLQTLNPLLEKEVQNISHNQNALYIKLEKKEDYEETPSGILDFFEKNRSREWGAQKCIIGAHLDDFSFFLREKPITATASRGEERSVLLGLLNAQKILLQKEKKITPLLLLDDVFSELDQSRQDALEKLCSGSQIFFTTTHKSHFKNFQQGLQTFEINKK